MTVSIPKWLRLTLGAIGVIIGLFIALIIVGAFILTTPYFAAKAGALLSDRSGRKVELASSIDAALWRSEPRIVLNDVRIANADWSQDPYMFEAKRITITIRPWPLLRARLVLPELTLESPRLVLEKNAEGQANWQFTQNPGAAVLKQPAPESRYDIPVIRHLNITDGQLTYRDPKEETETTVAVSTISGETGSADSIHVSGKGSYQRKPFTLDLTGASVLQLRDTNDPYPFALHVAIGPTTADVKGTVEDPVKMESLDVMLELKGANAADLFPITGIALPPTPSYRVAGHLTRGEDVWRFSDFAGRLGTSDLKGNLAWHANQEPPYFEGQFVSDNLDMKDLSGLIGANKKPADPDRVLPDTPLDISRMMAMNADVTFRGRRIKAPELLDDFSLNLSLKDGVLKVRPVSFGIARGKIEADLTIEGRANPPRIAADVRFNRLALSALFAPLAKRFGEDNVSAGLIGGRAQLKGTGKSLRGMLATADGTFGMGMEGGQLSRLLLELIGLDIFRAAGLIVTGDKPVAIHCVIGDFGVENGLMQAREFLIDTDVTTIRGSGSVNLNNEAMDMRLNVHPKDPSLFSARTPILIRGTLKRPAVGIDPAALAARGGIAAALGALLTPVGALLAFIEPGLGKESACRNFLQHFDKPVRASIPHQ